MASTVYKGDLSEVTFGKECGLALAYDGFGGLRFGTNAAGTVITFTGASEGFFDGSSQLRYPVGMLVGSQLRVKEATLSPLTTTLPKVMFTLSSLTPGLQSQFHLL